MVGVLIVAVAFQVKDGVELVRARPDVEAVFIFVLRLVMTGVFAVHLAGIEPTQVRISSEGMTWRGLGWVRFRPWSDFSQVGTYQHELGAGGIWVAARRTPEALRASTWAFPQRLISTSLEGSDEVTGLVRLTSPTWWPGWPGRRKPATPRRVWNVPDEDVIDAVRAHAGDRWIDELGPAERP